MADLTQPGSKNFDPDPSLVKKADEVRANFILKFGIRNLIFLPENFMTT